MTKSGMSYNLRATVKHDSGIAVNRLGGKVDGGIYQNREFRTESYTKNRERRERPTTFCFTLQ